MINRIQKIQLISIALEKIEPLLSSCKLCPRECGVNRYEFKKTFCASVSSKPFSSLVGASTLHFGEEPMLVGKGGSGTVFFSGCTLRCVYCQNYEISSGDLGKETDEETLANIFLSLKKKGAENINLVSPTHVLPAILKGLLKAYKEGLNIPIVYNTSGYERFEIINMLEGVVDIFLPDSKYMFEEYGQKYSQATNYSTSMKEAIKAMYKIASKHENGHEKLIIRHLVLPSNISSTYDFLIFLSENNITNISLSIMSQYSPRHLASQYEEINKTVERKEYENIVDYASSLNFTNILAQDFSSIETYLPNFQNEEPFETSR